MGGKGDREGKLVNLPYNHSHLTKSIHLGKKLNTMYRSLAADGFRSEYARNNIFPLVDLLRKRLDAFAADIPYDEAVLRSTTISSTRKQFETITIMAAEYECSASELYRLLLMIHIINLEKS